MQLVIFIRNSLQRVLYSRTFKWRLAHQQSIQQTAQRPNISFETIRFTADDLRGDVVRSSTKSLALFLLAPELDC